MTTFYRYLDIYDIITSEKFPLLHNKKPRFTHVTHFSQRVNHWLL